MAARVIFSETQIWPIDSYCLTVNRFLTLLGYTNSLIRFRSPLWCGPFFSFQFHLPQQLTQTSMNLIPLSPTHMLISSCIYYQFLECDILFIQKLCKCCFLCMEHSTHPAPSTFAKLPSLIPQASVRSHLLHEAFFDTQV